jgi:hypothetical protein
LLIITLAVGFALGAFILLGTILRWPVVIDPPQRMWWLFYSQLWIKWRFGGKAVVVYNYVVGSIVTVGTIVTAVEILAGVIKMPQ